MNGSMVIRLFLSAAIWAFTLLALASCTLSHTPSFAEQTREIVRAQWGTGPILGLDR